MYPRWNMLIENIKAANTKQKIYKKQGDKRNCNESRESKYVSLKK